MKTPEEEREIRLDVFRWLEERSLRTGGYEISRSELLNYSFRGERIPLLDTGRGIRNPATFRSTLSIMSGWKANKYNDFEDENGWIEYSYRDQIGGDNLKLINACELGEPIVYFRAVREGHYIPYFPVVPINDPDKRVVRFPLTEELALLGDPADYGPPQRRYAETVVRTRLHQPIFRARVLHAYQDSCSICCLKHTKLLDAAHIIPDAQTHGVPEVSNGIALCKIHHAAFDHLLLAISPEYKVQINRELLAEVDGPMLRYGLQEMHGHRIHVPRNQKLQPDRERLAERFELFKQHEAVRGSQSA